MPTSPEGETNIKSEQGTANPVSIAHTTFTDLHPESNPVSSGLAERLLSLFNKIQADLAGAVPDITNLAGDIWATQHSKEHKQNRRDFQDAIEHIVRKGVNGVTTVGLETMPIREILNIRDLRERIDAAKRQE